MREQGQRVHKKLGRQKPRRKLLNLVHAGGRKKVGRRRDEGGKSPGGKERIL